MNQFRFADVFVSRRRELRVTQEQIAAYVGVSRAAVSKWEKGQSYPDITILPKLATYFNISIDTLLGYEPQLTDDRIKQLYAQLAKQFAEQPFEEVKQQVEVMLTEYYACFPFVVKMAQLYLNYCKHAPDLQQTLDRVRELCQRVYDNSEEYSLKLEAKMIAVTALMMQGKAEEVLEQLGKKVQVQYGADQLVASAHMMLGRVEKAKEIMQVSLYQNVLAAVSIATESLFLHVGDEAYFDETVRRVQALYELFNIQTINVNLALVFHLKAATGYATQMRFEYMFKHLEQYANLCRTLNMKSLLQSDDYFYLLGNWMHVEMGLATVMPRDEQSIKHDLIAAITENPVFAPIQEQKQFQSLVINLQHVLTR